MTKSVAHRHRPAEARFARTDIPGNQLLGGMPPAVRARLNPHLRRVTVAAGQSIFRADEPLGGVYFPETAVFALLAHLNDGEMLDVALVGKDGIAGVAMLPGVNAMPCDAGVEIGGVALRVNADALKEVVRQSPLLHELLGRYAYSLFASGVQTAACNNFRPVRKRLARWLLMTHDLVDGEEFPITQNLLGTMLGVHRPSVTIAARALQVAGVIDYRHGRMKIRNRRLLEAASCDCYRAMRDEQHRLLGY